MEKVYKETFGDEGILQYLTGIENKLNGLLAEQFGKSSLKFDFEFSNAFVLLKKGVN